MKLDVFSFSNSGWSKKPEELSQLDSPSTLILIFGASAFSNQPEPINQIVKAFPNSVIMGSSSAGEIFGTKVSDGTLSVAICRFEKTKIKVASCEVGQAVNSINVGRKIGEELHANDLAGIFVLSDGLSVNGSALVTGLYELCPNIPITGGLAADGDRFKKTWVIHAGKPVANYVTAVGFYGPHFNMSHGSQGGWDIFGLERRITKSSENVLYELDGRPALDVYKEYLGEKAAGLPAAALLFPLQLRTNRNSQKSIVRTILSIDEATKSMTFAGNIPEGYLAQMMRANFDRLIDGAANAASNVVGMHKSKEPSLTVAISCVGRRLVLGERIEEEVEATLANLPPRSQQVGFYSYGEISPLVKGDACELHNQTMTLTTFSEAA